MRTSNRLFIDADLAHGLRLSLDDGQSHYLMNVLRLDDGADVRLFNGRDGEWRARLVRIDRRKFAAEVYECTRPQTSLPDFWLVFAPIKGHRLDMIIEKATELGAARLCPVWTSRTAVSRVNLDRMRAQAIEAAEQCERLHLPRLDEPTKLEALLGAWPQDRRLYFADEAGDAPFALSAFANHPKGDGAALLIGPEGGFSSDERARLRRMSFVQAITLGPRILRADTAAIAALTLLQAAAGDWPSA